MQWYVIEIGQTDDGAHLQRIEWAINDNIILNDPGIKARAKKIIDVGSNELPEKYKYLPGAEKPNELELKYYKSLTGTFGASYKDHTEAFTKALKRIGYKKVAIKYS